MVIPIRWEDEVLGVSKRGSQCDMTTTSVNILFLEDVILLYDYYGGKFVAGTGELDANESKELSTKLGIKISLTIT